MLRGFARMERGNELCPFRYRVNFIGMLDLLKKKCNHRTDKFRCVFREYFVLRFHAQSFLTQYVTASLEIMTRPLEALLTSRIKNEQIYCSMHSCEDQDS